MEVKTNAATGCANSGKKATIPAEPHVQGRLLIRATALSHSGNGRAILAMNAASTPMPSTARIKYSAMKTPSQTDENEPDPETSKRLVEEYGFISGHFKFKAEEAGNRAFHAGRAPDSTISFTT